jgi:lipopolysaccharide transport system permease protein
VSDCHLRLAPGRAPLRAKLRGVFPAPDDPKRLPAAAPARRTVIQPRASWIPRFWGDIPQYRDLLMSLIRRDVALRYKQTALGPAWILVQPILTAATFAFIFGSVARVDLDIDVPYFVYALVGMSLWTGFSQSLSRATTSILANVDLVTKIHFPRILLPLGAALATAVDCLLVEAGLAIYLIVSGRGLGPEVLVVIPVTFVALTFAASLAAGLGAALVRFRDVQYGLPLIVQSLLLVTPVLYPLSAVSDSVEDIARANPLTAVFETLRWGLLSSPAPSVGEVAYSVAAMVVLSLVGLSVFARLERDFADVI